VPNPGCAAHLTRHSADNARPSGVPRPYTHTNPQLINATEQPNWGRNSLMMTDWTDDELARHELLDAGQTVCVSMRNGVHPNLVAWAKERGLFVRIDRQSK
jgi:hypothetical protein